MKRNEQNTVTPAKKVAVSYFQVQTFRSCAAAYLKANPEETKLKYALEKVFERTTPLQEAFLKKIEDIEFENAATDDDDIVLFTTDARTGKRTYKFKKEGLKKRDEEVEKEFKKAKNAEFEPYYATDLPKDLHESWIKPFTPFVIAEVVN